jgi:hypothetical protein
MLGSITPLGERSRGARWIVTVSAYIVGAVGSGFALGGILGGIGQLLLPWNSPGRVALILLAGIALIGLVTDLRLLGIGLPSPKRQVDDAWLTRYRGWVYGLAFGAQLGLGVVTVVITSAVYVTDVALFLSASWLRGALLGATFGLIRGSTILATARVQVPHQLGVRYALVARFDSFSRRVALAAQFLLGAGILTAATLLGG